MLELSKPAGDLVLISNFCHWWLENSVLEVPREVRRNKMTSFKCAYNFSGLLFKK